MLKKWKFGARSAAAGAALLTVLLGSQAVMAQGFELQGFHPMPDPMGNFLSASSAEVAPHLGWSAMILANYANNPLVQLRDGERVERLVAHQGTGHLLLNLGLFDLLDLGVDLPVVFLQQGSAMPGSGVSPQDGGFGLGDLRVVPRVQLFSTRESADDKGVALAFLVDAHLPTGRSEYLQGGDLRIGPRVAFDISFGGPKLAVNAGYLYRGEQRLENLSVRDRINWSVAGEVPIVSTFRLTGEAFGSVTPGAEELRFHESPTEVLLGGKYTLGGFELLAGGGAGLVSGYGTPDFRAFLGLGWAHRPVEEVAPEPEPEPECRSATVAADCPDVPPARCEGGVLKSYAPICEDGDCAYLSTEVACAAGTVCGEEDGEPACVPEPECQVDADCRELPQSTCDDGRLTTYVGRCEEESCSYYPVETICADGEECGLMRGVPACVEKVELVEVDEETKRIEILEIVHFDTASARIQERSYGLLNQVAQVLENNPHLTSIRVEGHTDSRGAHEFNMQLSQDRAESVRAYLIDRGIESQRLKAVGYGPDRPVDDNATERGRAANRRVEFHIEEEE